MNIDDWKARRREKSLDKVNRELKELKKKGLEFEKGPKREKEVEVIENKCSLLKIIAVVLAIFWIVTIFLYVGRVSNLKSDVESAELELEIKMLEAEDLSSSLSNISVELENKRKGESELSDEVEDLIDLRKSLDEEVLDLTKEVGELDKMVATLKGNITGLESDLLDEKRLVDDYQDCIIDELGNLNVCDPYL
jgi:hypothetical protein